jgi:hypothetical protein
MGDPRQTFYLPVEGDPPVRFTMQALQMVESSTQKNVDLVGAHIFTGNFGVDMLVRVTRAGLEGARVKNRTGGPEWKLSRVADLFDDALESGVSFEEFANPVIDAFRAACERLGFIEKEPSEDPPPAAGTGTNSAEPPPEQD